MLHIAVLNSLCLLWFVGIILKNLQWHLLQAAENYQLCCDKKSKFKVPLYKKKPFYFRPT